MAERAYQLWTDDQPDFNWLTRVTSPRGEYGMRMRYVPAACRGCGALGVDDVFRLGFDPRIKITVKKGRNLLVTEDHSFCVSDELLQALKAADVKGFENKPLPETKWHVLSITQRRPFDQSIYQTDKRKCAQCGRQWQYGIAEFERQIDRPDEPLTFFSTATERGQGGYDIFVTEPLLEVLRGAGAKGVTFRRLLDAEEESELQEKRQKQPSWRPKGSVVVL